MTSILLPDLTTLSKLIAQLPQKEVENLICLRKRILECVINLSDIGFLDGFSNLLMEEFKIDTIVG